MDDDQFRSAESRLENRLEDELIRESARLSFVNAPIYPFLLVLVYLSSPISLTTPILVTFVTGLFLCALFRIAIAMATLRSEPGEPPRYKWWFRLGTVTQIMIWCIFSSSAIGQLGSDSFCAFSLFLIAAALAAAGSTSLSPDKPLARTYLLCIGLTHIPHFWHQAEPTTLMTAHIFFIYWGFQVGAQNRRLTSSILNSERLLLKTEDLEIANRQARDAQAAAEEANKAKSQFVATMSHEIRTPLHGVLGCNTLLLDSELSDEQLEYAEMIRNSGEALLAVINDILDLSKLEAGHELKEDRDFNLPELLAKCRLVVNQRLREKGLQFTTHIDPTLPELVNGDPNLLRQIILNLLSNAIKFTDTGSVSLDASVSGGSDQLVWLTVKVCDTGVGIPDEFKTDLFEPFRQATREQGGTGLGLAISSRLARLMGGELTAEDNQDRGSCFKLIVPYARVQKQPTKESDPKKPTRLTLDNVNSKRILIVEDNRTSQKLLKRLLSKVGLQCDTADDGEEALEAVINGERYDLILMDCYMPRMDGFDATRKIIDLLGNDAPPIVAVTANVSKEDQAQCVESGMVAFLSKPIRLKGLQEVLDLHLGSESV